ncbi:hypothetical protein [Nonomuraea sp. NPDC046570]|uniref:hypothetical protein n=1 Tax=Nonomuraea sp. NPDC046570 TaxID=3155255 RepID=UPI0033C46890
MDTSALWTEAIKALPSLGIALVTLTLGWLVGNRLTARWDERKKRRELDLLALGVFYDIYGQFFAIWKLWSAIPTGMSDAEEFRRGLLERAAEIEGRLESLLVRIATERKLSDRDGILLGCFRQAVQGLRESIRDSVPLRSRVFRVSDQKLVTWEWAGSEDPPYVAFKALAAFVGELLTKRHQAVESTAVSSAIRKITSNRLERMWLEETFKLLGLTSPAWPVL